METGRPMLMVSGEVALVLLYNLYLSDKEFGHLDALYSAKDLYKGMMPAKVKIPRAILESALCSSNLLSEVGKFWHPEKKPFNHFIARVTRETATRFNTNYNWLTEKNK